MPYPSLAILNPQLGADMGAAEMTLSYPFLIPNTVAAPFFLPTLESRGFFQTCIWYSTSSPTTSAVSPVILHRKGFSNNPAAAARALFLVLILDKRLVSFTNYARSTRAYRILTLATL